ncbi:MAG TPA: DUF4157 domain-containing protein [Gemmatimonadaceae bacterium]|nr:DUF4157 domain-containing protein [Gemmatimonadaceae bacterium]
MGASDIVAALIGRRVTLSPALRARYPELERVRWRRGGIPVNVASWFIGSAAAITLWRTVFLSHTVSPDDELLLHEFRHVQQFESSVTFPLRYLWESARRGYFANRFEVDARDYAAQRLRGVD